jgi:peroxiredoxin
MMNTSFCRHAAALVLMTTLSGSPAPDFTLKSLDGQPVKLSDFRGKLALLNFWAPWCAPCKVELPWFVDFYKQYRSRGLEIIGVAVDFGGKEEVAKFVRDRNVNYPILLGNTTVADAYGGLHFLPQSFLIDRDGRITRTVVGITTKSELENLIKQALPNPAASHQSATTRHGLHGVQPPADLPPFSLPDVDGKIVRSAEVLGRVRLSVSDLSRSSTTGN